MPDFKNEFVGPTKLVWITDKQLNPEIARIREAPKISFFQAIAQFA